MTLRHWDSLLSGTVAGPPGPSGTSQEASGDVENVPDMANKIAVRDADGDAGFREVTAATLVEVGTEATGKARVAPTYVEVGDAPGARFQATTPTVAGQLQADPATGRASVYTDGAARELLTERDLFPYTFTMPADSSAGAETIESVVWDGIPYDIEVTDVWFRPNGNLDTHATNIAIITIRSRNDAGGEVGGVVANTTPSDLGAVGALQRAEFSLSTPFTVPADGMVTIEIVKEGTGTQLPSGAYTLVWRRA